MVDHRKIVNVVGNPVNLYRLEVINMKKFAIVLAILFIGFLPVDNALAFNDDNVRPKIAMVEVGNYLYGTNPAPHDLSTPFDIYVYMDGNNEEDNINYDWSGSTYYLFIEWWHVQDGTGAIHRHPAAELVSPDPVGAYQKYHYYIPNQDGSIDTEHDDYSTYYGNTGNTWSQYGAGKVFFYVYGYSAADESGTYQTYQSYGESTPMAVTFVGVPDPSAPPLEPADEGLLVGLEDVLGNIAEDIGEAVSNVAVEISNNPVLLPLVLISVGGVIGILFIARTGGIARFTSKLSPKPQTKKKQPVKRKVQKKTTKKKGGFLSNLMKPPKPTPARKNRRKRT